MAPQSTRRGPLDPPYTGRENRISIQILGSNEPINTKKPTWTVKIPIGTNRKPEAIERI